MAPADAGFVRRRKILTQVEAGKPVMLRRGSVTIWVSRTSKRWMNWAAKRGSSYDVSMSHGC
jgi:hypothetical protein